MRCPVCRTVELLKQTYEGLNVHQCPKCFGHLLPRLRADAIKRRANCPPEELEQKVMLERAEDSQRLVKCPRCGGLMRKQNKARPVRFQIDLCRKCDVLWLDGGELALLQLHYESSPQAQETREMQRRWEEMPEERKRAFVENVRKLPLTLPFGDSDDW